MAFPPVVFANLPDGLNPLSLFDLMFGAVLGSSPTIITSGASYTVLSTDSRILVNKTIGSATSIVFPVASAIGYSVLVKDLKGDAFTNNITITFTGGQRADGLSSVPISTNYGAYWFTPKSGGFYINTG